MTADREPLERGWVLLLHPEARGRLETERTEVAATVPGCVQTDLMAAGLLADPTIALHEHDQHWIGEANWTYRLRFDVAPPAPAAGERVDLVFEGLDTVATLTLNGTVIGAAKNQHRRYRFDVGAALRADGNVLDVHFASPVVVARAHRERLGDMPNPYGEPYNFIRKMACNFGWDWGPRLVTSGIWRPARLERWRTARLASVRPTPLLASEAPRPGDWATVAVAIDLERAPGGLSGALLAQATLTSPAGEVVGAASAAVDDQVARLTLVVDDVRRWWPAGRGDQPLYRLDVRLTDDTGSCIDRATRRLGFRHVRLDTTEDESGARFAFVVNGERLWIRGFNWIPADCFPSRITAEQVAAGIDAARGAHANLLRVWGGGLYESDAFYDHCDERGMLVWQDFAFACSPYPEELLWDEAAAEAADNIDRLMPHPSLLVWNGNNESLWGWADWGWPEALGGRRWGSGFYYDLLPGVVAARDPARPYLDGSPTSLDPARHPNDPARGPVHLWDVWNEQDYTHYRDHHPRFVAEFGFQAPATWATLDRAVEGRRLTVDDPALLHRQRAFDGAAKLGRWLHEHFDTVSDYDDWLYLTQVNQARAVEVGIGHFRAAHEHCAGALWWQLNDCWPAISWAVVDSAGRAKPAWFAVRRMFADRLVTLQPAGDGLELVLVNDGLRPWHDTARVVRVAADGAERSAVDLQVAVGAGTAERWLLPAWITAESLVGRDLVVATVAGRRAVFAAGRDDRRAFAPAWDLDLAVGNGVVEVDVTARTLVRDLCLFPDRVDPDARVDDQLLTLLPDERRRLRVRTTQLDPERWRDALAPQDGRSLVLRALGDRVDVPYTERVRVTVSSRERRER